MADAIDPWPTEDIPDNDLLFMRAHRNYFEDDGSLGIGVFRNRPTEQDGMSTDWEKYSTPQEARDRARTPRDNAILKMVAGDVRRIPSQTVVHEPDPHNRAHTEVFGDKKATPEVRVLFGRIFEYAIRLDE